MIENQPKEITLLYHSDKAEDKKARAFVETITGFAIKTLDLKKDQITETQLAEIANKMDAPIAQLFDPTYSDRFHGNDSAKIDSASDADLLTVLVNEPVLIKTPIAIIGKKAYSYSSAYEILTSKMDKESDGLSMLKGRVVF